MSFWAPEEIEQIEELREAIEKRPDQIFELASDENFELSMTDGLYQKLAMSIAFVKKMDPEIVISPESDVEYMVYFCLGNYGIYTFPFDPEGKLSDTVSDFFKTETTVPEYIWKTLYSRSHREIRNW